MPYRDGMWDTCKKGMKNREKTAQIIYFQGSAKMEELHTDPFLVKVTV